MDFLGGLQRFLQSRRSDEFDERLKYAASFAQCILALANAKALDAKRPHFGNCPGRSLYVESQRALPGKFNFNFGKKKFMNYAISGASKDQAGGSR